MYKVSCTTFDDVPLFPVFLDYAELGGGLTWFSMEATSLIDGFNKMFDFCAEQSIKPRSIFTMDEGTYKAEQVYNKMIKDNDV